MGAAGHGRAAVTARDVLCGVVVNKRSAPLCAVTVAVALVTCVLYLPDPFASDPPASASASAPTRRGPAAVTLLVWTHPFGHVQLLPDCKARFRVAGCTLTNDKRAYPQAEAVIIHHRDVATGGAELPQDPRPRDQKWIWLNYESPTHTPHLWHFEGVFNLTMSYRTDSDIFLPYGYLVPRVRNAKSDRATRTLHTLSPSHPLRPRLVAWVVSNWSERHARVAFYHLLRRHVRVDVYGKAGWPVPGRDGAGAVVHVIRRYQFYLALENSQHTDYVTEKLWNAVQAGAVPVVLGPSRKNYERFLPPEAFIHVDDFPTVRELARYLLLLWRNPTLLRRHLDWRGRYSMHRPDMWAEHYCAACRAVRRNRGRTNVVRDLTYWFYS